MTRLSKCLSTFCRSISTSSAKYTQPTIYYFEQPFQENVSFTLPLVFSRGLDKRFEHQVAFTDYTGKNFNYGNLTRRSIKLAQEIKTLVPVPQEIVAFLCERDVTFPITLGATWWAQQIAIPLTPSHPDSMLEYFLKSTSTKLLITSKIHADRMNRIAKAVGSQLLVLDKEFEENCKFTNNTSLKSSCNSFSEDKGAVILFTSGTTGKPKGVLLTHGNLKAQVENICGAWQISEQDTMLHVLPLHHTHGLIHAMLSPMAGGARCQMLEKFDTAQTWQELLSWEQSRPTIFTAVPTVFVKLIEKYDQTFAKDFAQIARVREICQEKMRLFLSGSASLPVPILEKFESLTGHRILERYGMTETGLILCNPLHGERKPGFVGRPLETVELMLADSEKSEARVVAVGDAKKIEIVKKISGKDEKISGDLLVKGPSVFKEYWGNPEATAKDFTEDGWFKTGDYVEFSQGSFKVLGRNSVDIIKSGGYKLSALEIETQLLALKDIKEVAVLGIPDAVWGQKVAAVVVWTEKELTENELKEMAKSRLPSYACPQLLKSLSEMPRNHLGKVNKKELTKLFS